MRYLILVPALVLLVACGSSSPTAPATAAVPPPVPPTVAPPKASIVNSGDLITDHCAGGMCAYEAHGQNTGNGCAAQVRGTVTLTSTRVAVVDLDWSLEGARVVRPGDLFAYGGPVAETHADATGGYRAAFQWADAPC